MKITYFGHSAFRIETGSSIILLDPFLSENPHYEGTVDDASQGVTHIVLTHGHFDHVGDTVDIATKHGCKVLATFELASWLGGKGVETAEPLNTGGTAAFDDFTVTLTQAFHSSASVTDNGEVTYLGQPNGIVLHCNDGPTVYHMGDTDIFGDMALIDELHSPKIGLVPVGDRLTMGCAVAALACRRYFDFDRIIPIHYGTMPILEQETGKFSEAMEGDANRVHNPKIAEPFEV